MRSISIVASIALLFSTAHAFFIPLTTEQRVKEASVIAVIKIDAINKGEGFALKGFVDAKVVTGIVGVKEDEKIRVLRCN